MKSFAFRFPKHSYRFSCIIYIVTSSIIQFQPLRSSRDSAKVSVNVSFSLAHFQCGFGVLLEFLAISFLDFLTLILAIQFLEGPRC